MVTETSFGGIWIWNSVLNSDDPSWCAIHSSQQVYMH